MKRKEKTHEKMEALIDSHFIVYRLVHRIIYNLARVRFLHERTESITGRQRNYTKPFWNSTHGTRARTQLGYKNT